MSLKKPQPESLPVAPLKCCACRRETGSGTFNGEHICGPCLDAYLARPRDLSLGAQVEFQTWLIAQPKVAVAA